MDVEGSEGVRILRHSKLEMDKAGSIWKLATAANWKGDRTDSQITKGNPNQMNQELSSLEQR